MTKYLLVPGACHRGWWFEPVAEALRAAGHEADLLPRSPFAGIAESLRGDPGWAVTDLESRHNLLANGPDDLVRIMLGLGR